MEKEVAETLAYFSQHAFELRQLGKEWGLNEEEVEQCIERAMSIDPKDLPAPDKKKTTSAALHLKFAARKTWPKFRVLLWVVGVFMGLVAVGALALQNEYIDHRVSQIMAPTMYPFFRFLRLATVSLHDHYNLYDAYNEECMVDNPFYDKERLLGDHICENCERVKQAREYTPDSLEAGGTLPGTAFINPLFFKGQGRNVTFDTFQAILTSNPFSGQPMLGLTTNLAWASQLSDLLQPGVTDRLTTQPDFYFFWNSKLVWTSQLMRKVFPKPSMLGPMEVAIHKTIYITGPQAPSFPLMGSTYGSHSWYVQGTGSRKVELTPITRCQRECSPFNVTLSQGDMLAYSAELYSGKVHPAGDDISIAFQGHINSLHTV